MAACEQCWRDAGGDAVRYAHLLEERKHNPCAPERQAGLGGHCYRCNRDTLHMYVGVCMNKDCKGFNTAPAHE
jgi:hypothetical protein